ncbi:hypothetical protein MHYP_G00194780 [Metynnis hypsauchen]
MEQQIPEGWHYSVDQLHDTVMVEPDAGQITNQMCSTESVQSVPCWLPLPHDSQASQWCHNAQRMVYQFGHPYNDYQDMGYQAGFHCPQPDWAVVQQIYGVPVGPSFVEVPPHMISPLTGDHGHLSMLPTPHSDVLSCYDMQASPAAAYPIYGLSNEPQVPALFHPTNPRLQGLGVGAGLQNESLPEATSLEDAMRFFQCGPEAKIAEISEIQVKPELGEVTADFGSHSGYITVAEDHSLDRLDLQTCRERHLEVPECYDGPVFAAEAAHTMDFFYSVEDFDQLSEIQTFRGAVRIGSDNVVHDVTWTM